MLVDKEILDKAYDDLLEEYPLIFRVSFIPEMSSMSDNKLCELYNKVNKVIRKGTIFNKMSRMHKSTIGLQLCLSRIVDESSSRPHLKEFIEKLKIYNKLCGL